MDNPEKLSDLIKDITGYISVALLALLYVPQTYSVYKNKNPSGLNWFFLIIGIFLTIDTMVYGTLLEEAPLVIANVIACICIIMMIIAKVIWKTIDPEKTQETIKINSKGEICPITVIS